MGPYPLGCIEFGDGGFETLLGSQVNFILFSAATRAMSRVVCCRHRTVYRVIVDSAILLKCHRERHEVKIASSVSVLLIFAPVDRIQGAKQVSRKRATFSRR